MVFSAIKAGSSKVNSPLRPNFEHMWDFKLAQVICKFHKDLIKKWKDYALINVIYGLFQQSRANNPTVTGLIRPEFKLVWDVMPVLVTCPLGSLAMQEKEYEPRHEKTCFCHMWTTKAFVVCSLNSCYVQNFKTLASFSSWAGWFEFNLVANPRRQAFLWHGSYCIFWCVWKNQSASFSTLYGAEQWLLWQMSLSTPNSHDRSL